MKRLVVAALVLLALGVSAHAQNRVLQKVIEGGAQNASSAAAPAGIPKDILGALDDKILPDLQYAKAMADATGSIVTAGCYAAWIDLIQNRKKALTGPDGQPLTLPDPHLITDFERVVELRNALQPDSKFSVACSPVANMVKKDILQFISTIVTGGAGLSLMGIGL